MHSLGTRNPGCMPEGCLDQFKLTAPNACRCVQLCAKTSHARLQVKPAFDNEEHLFATSLLRRSAVPKCLWTGGFSRKHVVLWRKLPDAWQTSRHLGTGDFWTFSRYVEIREHKLKISCSNGMAVRDCM